MRAAGAVDDGLAEGRRIRWWEEYTRRNGNEMNNNPSPGNKAGGLLNITIKSLGAVAKGGTSRDTLEVLGAARTIAGATDGQVRAAVLGGVADGVAEAVVDTFEVAQVEKHQRRAGPANTWKQRVFVCDDAWRKAGSPPAPCT